MKKIIIIYWLSLPIVAYGYLDPNAGNILFLFVFSLFSTVFFLFRKILDKIKNIVYAIIGRKNYSDSKTIIFYSEGANYWNTFKPILNELEKMNRTAIYLTSDDNDPGLIFPYQNIKTKYIGQGNKAYTYLNNLHANVCVMTTPNLNVFQIKCSKNVKHYCHVVHMPTDMLNYKLYSLDYYDSVLCSGNHQIKSIRALEKLRNTKIKDLFLTGCPYTDVLIDKVNTQKKTIKIKNNNKESIHVLIAPTWGNNSLLKRTQLNFLDKLCDDSNFQVTIRPHPQSLLVEKKLIESIQNKYHHVKQITWDTKKDVFFSLHESDILFSDTSGIIFDYALIFEKPVIYLDHEPDWLGTEAGELNIPPWEMSILDKLGTSISPSNLNNLNKLLYQCVNNHHNNAIKKIREQCLINYAQAGICTAKQIVKLHEKLLTLNSQQKKEKIQKVKIPLTKAQID